VNNSIAKLFKKAAALMSTSKVQQKAIYKHLKKTYEKEPNARLQVERFIAEKTQMEGEGDA
jgi:hypothetical protein